MKKIITALFGIATLATFGGVPIKWTVETSRADIQEIDVYRGETLDLEVQFKSYGKVLVLPTNEVACTYWQTNGMETAYWRTNNVEILSTNGVMRSFFDANMDVGAKTIRGFIGIAGNIYRASFVLRFKEAPGYTPAKIEWPYRELDFSVIQVKNAPYYLKSEVENKISNVVELVSLDHIHSSEGEIWADGRRVRAYYGEGYGTWEKYYNGNLAGTFTWHAEDEEHPNSWNRLPESTEWIIFNSATNFTYINPAETIEFRSYDFTFTDWQQKVIRLVYEPTLTTNEIATIDDITGSGSIGSNVVVAIVRKEVPTWARDSTKPTYDAEEVGAYSSEMGNTLASQVETIATHLNAEDARFVSTNYNSSTKMPEAYVEIKQTDSATGSNVWLNVWREMTRWNEWTGETFDWTTWGGFIGWKTNLENSVSEKSPREYAFYDGVTGNVAPDDYFWISQPHIAVCAGAAYQRYLDGEHEIWVLESNGLVADVNGTTNGFFRISDSEGETQFEIVKGDKQTVFANANSLTQQSVSGVTHYFTTYAVTNAVAAPTAKFTASLTNQVWYADTDANCPCNVEWTAGANSYTLEWWPKTSMPTMFVKAEYERGGETYINNVAPTKMQTIVIGKKKYSIGTTTISGETVLKLTEVN